MPEDEFRRNPDQLRIVAMLHHVISAEIARRYHEKWDGMGNSGRIGINVEPIINSRTEGRGDLIFGRNVVLANVYDVVASLCSYRGNVGRGGLPRRHQAGWRQAIQPDGAFTFSEIDPVVKVICQKFTD